MTANKQLLAQHGADLFAAAEETGVHLRFEASAVGAVPVIKVLRESLVAAEVKTVFGIVNGTTNYMLSEMAATGADYDDVLGRPSGSATPRPTPRRTSVARTPRPRWRSSVDRLPQPHRGRRCPRMRASPEGLPPTSPTACGSVSFAQLLGVAKLSTAA